MSGALQTLTGIRKVTVQYGDTLQSIAARELGDATLWPVLAAANALQPPYIVDDLTQLEGTASGAVLLAGMPIKIPAPGRVPSGVLDATDLYGTDLDLTGGDLSATASGDLALLAGVPNLAQALSHRLDTEPGELLFHRDYGCRIHELKGENNGPALNQLAAGYVARALNSDPRIARTQGITATVQGDAVTVAATAVAIDGKHLPVGGT